MFYKLLNGGKILDVMKSPVYCKLQENGCLVTCGKAEANGVISSDGKWAYQIAGDYRGRFATKVDIVEIDQSEYEELSKIYPNPDNTHLITDDTFNRIKSDYRDKLMREVSAVGYNS